MLIYIDVIGHTDLDIIPRILSASGAARIWVGGKAVHYGILTFDIDLTHHSCYRWEPPRFGDMDLTDAAKRICKGDVGDGKQPKTNKEVKATLLLRKLELESGVATNDADLQ